MFPSKKIWELERALCHLASAPWPGNYLSVLFLLPCFSPSFLSFFSFFFPLFFYTVHLLEFAWPRGWESSKLSALGAPSLFWSATLWQIVSKPSNVQDPDMMLKLMLSTVRWERCNRQTEDNMCCLHVAVMFVCVQVHMQMWVCVFPCEWMGRLKTNLGYLQLLYTLLCWARVSHWPAAYQVTYASFSVDPRDWQSPCL